MTSNVFSLGNYDDGYGSRTLIGECAYRFYYRKQWYLVDTLARWVQDYLKAHNLEKKIDLVLPVPTNLATMDYDPASLLVDWISQLTNIPRIIGAIKRNGQISEYTSDVSSKGNFIVDPAVMSSIKGQHLLLVDGIMSSGETVTKARQALLKEGAASVTVLVLTNITQNQKI